MSLSSHISNNRYDIIRNGYSINTFNALGVDRLGQNVRCCDVFFTYIDDYVAQRKEFYICNFILHVLGN